MIRQIYNAYADNVMIEKIEVNRDTAKGIVLHSNAHDLPPGTIVLYQDNEWNSIYLNEDKEVDIIWRPKIRAIIKEVEVVDDNIKI
jgi:hypothetical protein